MSILYLSNLKQLSFPFFARVSMFRPNTKRYAQSRSTSCWSILTCKHCRFFPFAIKMVVSRCMSWSRSTARRLARRTHRCRTWGAHWPRAGLRSWWPHKKKKEKKKENKN